MEQNQQLIETLATKIAQAQASKAGIANLAAAFVAAKKEIQNPTKNASNPHFGAAYATLDAVLAAFTEPFATHDLALIQAPGEITPEGHVSVVGLLIHKSGESIQFRTQVPLGPKATAQAAGSAITYARRYQAAAIAGIAQVDDDGNAASSDAPRKPAGKTKEPSYADGVENLVKSIADCADVAALEALKPLVAELGDQKVADAYVSRRKTLKGAK